AGGIVTRAARDRSRGARGAEGAVDLPARVVRRLEGSRIAAVEEKQLPQLCRLHIARKRVRRVGGRTGGQREVAQPGHLVVGEWTLLARGCRGDGGQRQQPEMTKRKPGTPLHGQSALLCSAKRGFPARRQAAE